MFDTVESLNHSLIQHGQLNKRIYLMDLDKRDHPQIFSLLDKLAEKKDYSKIFAKIPKWAVYEAKKNEYEVEAKIPGFFSNKIDGYFLGKFLDHSRSQIDETTAEKIKKVHLSFQKYKKNLQEQKNANETNIRRLFDQDAEKLAKLYASVFETYPFPIYKADYLKKMMKQHVHYYGVLENDELVSASAAEMNPSYSNVEMTDFATLPEKRGNNYALSLLHHMEYEMKKEKMKTAFTIARAISFGMNITFAKADYTFAGLLKNNTAIAGSLENMNVLFKKI